MADNQPQIEHPDLPASPDTQPEVPTAPEPEPAGFYGGKYKSIEDWEQATRHSEQEGTRLANRVRELEAETMRLQSQQRVNPAEQREARKDPAQELNDFGVPVDPVRELVRSELTEFFKPQIAAQNAMMQVSQRRPDFMRFRNDVETWLASRPEIHQRYQQALQQSPDMADVALDWVFDRFSEDRRNTALPDRGTPPTADAAIPVSQAKADRLPGAQSEDAEQVKRSIDYFRQFKDEGPYARLRLKEILNAHPDLPKA